MRPLIILIGLITIGVGILLTVTLVSVIIGVPLFLIGIIILCLGLFTFYTGRKVNRFKRRFI